MDLWLPREKGRAIQVALMVKNLPANAGDIRKLRFDPWVRKILCRRKWQPAPVFLPGESHGQRSLAGYSPWGCKELGMTEATEYMHICIERERQRKKLPCFFSSCSVTHLCPTLCDPVDCSTPGFPGGLVSKDSAYNAGDHLQYWRPGFSLWVGTILEKEMAAHSSILA